MDKKYIILHTADSDIMCNDLKTDIMEVNGKDFSSYPVEHQRDIIIKLIQICSPDNLRLVS